MALSTQFFQKRHLNFSGSVRFVSALPARRNADEGTLYILFNATDGSSSLNVYDANGGADGKGGYSRMPGHPKVTYVQAVKDVNTLHGTATSGNFTLTWVDQYGNTGTTANIVATAAAAAVVAALTAVGLVCTATGGALGTADVVLTTTTLIGPVTLTINNVSLAGGTVTNTHTTPGVNVVNNGDIAQGDVNYGVANAVTIAASTGIYA